MKKHIFIAIDGPLCPQDNFEARLVQLDADVRATLSQHLKQKAHIDEIKRLCHVPMER